MAFTTTQLEALEAAFASGTLSVSYDGKSVTYRSLADLERAISVVRAALYPNAVKPRSSRATFSKS
jgi:hypothetical protein